tara:strand:+ start:424 stop:948 length:525 start_codon:yes stop_codon:yes gene_type:complete
MTKPEFQGSPEEKYLSSLDCFQIPDTCCSNGCALWFGLCAYPCVQGMMMQQVQRGSMSKEDAGFFKFCYFENAFPCVCSDSCCAVFFFNSIASSAGQGSQQGRLLASGAQTGLQAGIRSNLVEQAGGDGNLASSFLQTCLPCYCVQFNDAAYVIAKKKQQDTKKSQSIVSNLVF